MRRCGERMASKAARRSRYTEDITPGGAERRGERVHPAAMCLIQKEIRIGPMVTTTDRLGKNIRARNGPGGNVLSGTGIGRGSRFQETWPVVDEQTENCAGE